MDTATMLAFSLYLIHRFGVDPPATSDDITEYIKDTHAFFMTLDHTDKPTKKTTTKRRRTQTTTTPATPVTVDAPGPGCCHQVLKTGTRQGDLCGKKGAENSPVFGYGFKMCGIHYKQYLKSTSEPEVTTPEPETEPETESETCITILKTGTRQGDQCGKKAIINSHCGTHNKGSPASTPPPSPKPPKSRSKGSTSTTAAKAPSKSKGSTSKAPSKSKASTSKAPSKSKASTSKAPSKSKAPKASKVASDELLTIRITYRTTVETSYVIHAALKNLKLKPKSIEYDENTEQGKDTMIVEVKPGKGSGSITREAIHIAIIEKIEPHKVDDIYEIIVGDEPLAPCTCEYCDWNGLDA
jgi:hypothetical protein